MAYNCLTIVEDYVFPWRTSSGLRISLCCRCDSCFATDRSGFEGSDDFRRWICDLLSGLLVASFSWIRLCSPRMTHHFSIDPRSILGVGAEASMEEIQSAFRDKSKKHHPDLGGDEWAFHMVVRAYEILKTTREGSKRGMLSPQPRQVAGVSRQVGGVAKPTAATPCLLAEKTSFSSRPTRVQRPVSRGSDPKESVPWSGVSLLPHAR